MQLGSLLANECLQGRRQGDRRRGGTGEASSSLFLFQNFQRNLRSPLLNNRLNVVFRKGLSEEFFSVCPYLCTLAAYLTSLLVPLLSMALFFSSAFMWAPGPCRPGLSTGLWTPPRPFFVFFIKRCPCAGHIYVSQTFFCTHQSMKECTSLSLSFSLLPYTCGDKLTNLLRRKNYDPLAPTSFPRTQRPGWTEILGRGKRRRRREDCPPSTPLVTV